MDYSDTSQSGQPKSVYVHPRELTDLIYKQLGVYIGFISFQNNFKGLTDLLMTMKLLKTIEDEDKIKNYGILVNEHTKKPIKTRLDRYALEKLEQIWERGGYLLTEYIEELPNVIDIKQEKYLYEYPKDEIPKNMEIMRIPALFSLKSKDSVTSEKFLLRINEGVPESEAYRWQDPVILCENGKLEYEENGIIKPFFKIYDDIVQSPHYTQDVPRLYYDIMTTIAWRESLTWLHILHINIWQIAKELEEFDYSATKKETIKRKKIEEA